MASWAWTKSIKLIDSKSEYDKRPDITGPQKNKFSLYSSSGFVLSPCDSAKAVLNRLARRVVEKKNPQSYRAITP